MTKSQPRNTKPLTKAFITIVCVFIGIIIIDICTTLSTPGAFPILTCLILWFGFPALALVVIILTIIQAIKNRQK